MKKEYHQPFWFRDALSSTNDKLCPPLNGEHKTDICIIGGGYTGLWTAIKIKQRQPNCQVTILEKGRCGQGASGRNGGCMLTFATKFPTLLRLFGVEEAIRLVKSSEQAVFDIDTFCRQHNIDAEIRTDGALYTATNNAQNKQLHQPIELLSEHSINRWQNLSNTDAVRLSGTSKTLGAISTDAAGSLNPGKLVLGLKHIALSLGIKIFEHTSMQSYQADNICSIQSSHGQVKSRKLIFAINAWTGKHLPGFNRHYALVSSDMLITKPIPEQLSQIGLTHGKAIADSRIFVHYYRTTVDGRLMLGKGGNLFAFANKVLPEFEQASSVEHKLKASFSAFFPTLFNQGNLFEPSWTGASDRSVTGLPFFGTIANQPNVSYGLGYSGNGVVQSFLGGEILASLALNIDNAWTRSPMAKGPLGKFPPEPIRYIGANIIKHAINRKENAEDNEQSPWWLDIQLAKFAAAAGKADK